MFKKIKENINKIVGLASAFVLSFVIGASVNAQASTTPAEMLNEAGGAVVNTAWDLFIGFINSWLGYLFVIVLISVIFGFAWKLLHLSSRK